MLAPLCHVCVCYMCYLRVGIQFMVMVWEGLVSVNVLREVQVQMCVLLHAT